jgi:hypothetical protein
MPDEEFFACLNDRRIGLNTNSIDKAIRDCQCDLDAKGARYFEDGEFE